MAENTMTAEERAGVLAAIEAGEPVWMIHPDGFAMGVKFEAGAMEQVEGRVAAGYTLTAPPSR